MVDKVYNLPKHSTEKADKYVSKHYSLWSTEGQDELRQGLSIAINNKHKEDKAKIRKRGISE